MMTLNPLSLCSSKFHNYNNYDKATYIDFSTPSLLTCPQATGLAWNPHLKGIVQMVFLHIHSFIFGVKFSNNKSIFKVRVNIKET